MRAHRVVLLAALLSCGGGDHGPTDFSLTEVQPPADGRAEFSAYPVDMTPTGTIEPLGHLAPPGHTLPTDHVYFYAIDYDHAPITRDTIARGVDAPATAALFFIYTGSGTGGDAKLMFRATRNFHFYLDHVVPRAGLKLGDVVKAGERIGTTVPGIALDLGAFDLGAPAQPFVNRSRYPDQTSHAVSPFRYYVEPLRSQLYARQRRLPSAPADAPIAFDRAGRLVGNWFDETVPITPGGSDGPTMWPRHLAFVYDNRDPSLPRVSIGGTISRPFIGTIPADAPRFENVSTASGRVTYSIRYTESTNVQFGLMLVEMIADDRIRVEIFEDPLLKSADFTTKAHTYVR